MTRVAGLYLAQKLDISRLTSSYTDRALPKVKIGNTDLTDGHTMTLTELMETCRLSYHDLAE